MEYTRAAGPDTGWSGPRLDMLLGFTGFAVAIADASGRLSVVGLALGFFGLARSTAQYADTKLRAGAMLALQKRIEQAQIILRNIRAATAPKPEIRQ